MKKQSTPKQTKKRPLKIGFDLDGVMLYNPLRILRPIVYWIKKLFIKKRLKVFFIPHTPFQKFLWKIFHFSSFLLAPGFHEIKKLVDEGKIEAYLITARYSFLGESVKRFIERVDGEDIFKKWYYNKNDEQPHFYKDALIKKLGIDVFIEDNYDIVKYLSDENKKTKVYWVTNILDSGIDYKYKCNGLKEALEDIKKRDI